MPSGIHVEVAIGDPSVCQVAPYSEREGTVTSVRKIPHHEQDGAVIQEFTLAADGKEVEPDGGWETVGEEVEKLFTIGPKEVFRFSRETPQHCVCERIERMGCPIREINAVDGTIHVRFIATDHDTLQTVLSRLSDFYDDLDVNRLLHSEDTAEAERLVVTDIGAMTDRQREVLATAHEMGYFDHPKSASAAAVADELDIAPSTVTEHIAAAQRNLLDELLDT